MLIRLYAITDGDDLDRVVECSEDEWLRLTAYARAKNLPIDGATVDTDLLNELMDRPEQDGKPSKHVPLV